MDFPDNGTAAKYCRALAQQMKEVAGRSEQEGEPFLRLTYELVRDLAANLEGVAKRLEA